MEKLVKIQKLFCLISKEQIPVSMFRKIYEKSLSLSGKSMMHVCTSSWW